MYKNNNSEIYSYSARVTQMYFKAEINALNKSLNKNFF